MNQKGFAPILIVVGILVIATIAGATYYFGRSQTTKLISQSPVVTLVNPESTSTSNPSDETANWKTYTNTKYGFSFKYPTNLTISPNSRDTLADFADSGSLKLEVSILEKPTNLNLKDYVKKMENLVVVYEKYEYQEFKINNYNGTVAQLAL